MIQLLLTGVQRRFSSASVNPLGRRLLRRSSSSVGVVSRVYVLSIVTWGRIWLLGCVSLIRVCSGCVWVSGLLVGLWCWVGMLLVFLVFLGSVVLVSCYRVFLEFLGSVVLGWGVTGCCVPGVRLKLGGTLYQEVDEQYANISLEGEDDGELGIDFLVPDDQALNVELCIMGRLLTGRAIDFEAMRHVMAFLWQPGKGVYAKDIDTNRYLFHFFHEIDLERVVEGSPWTFNRVQFVFHKLRRRDDPKRVVLNNLDIWVQIHGLQPGLKSASVVEN
uniref:DUF4283 domain-containing protein n=1 Tax=Cannabis sativa TaxID=3483 RepID=A0A803NMB0_CANSA